MEVGRNEPMTSADANTSDFTRRAQALFATKVALLRARRAARDVLAGPARLIRNPLAPVTPFIAESRTPLWSDPTPAEQRHQLGKVQNLRRAARALHGTTIPPGAIFSFWRQLGPPTRHRGFVEGRMLQQGCMVGAIGGGLCQLSNAIYDVALQAGCTILERHAHSRLVPGSAAAAGRDATVAWNYVDLRFSSPNLLHLAIHLTQTDLLVRLHGPSALPAAAIHTQSLEARAQADSCATCDQLDCLLHESGTTVPMGQNALLIDEAWPEFITHAATHLPAALGLPLRGRLASASRNAWPTANFAPVLTAPAAALTRSLAVRLARTPPSRRHAELAGTDRLAIRLAALLGPTITQACVAQSYLPALWRDGHLAARRFSVLLTRLPLHLLHARLDEAARNHPGHASLTDFRAPPELVEWERQALEAAESVITPHAEIAAFFPARSIHLPWRLPEIGPVVTATRPHNRIAFPGPTLARKGAYELREAARTLDLEIMLLGRDLEGPEFWQGVRTTRPGPGGPATWLNQVDAVVQPAVVEDRPRHLLAAQAAGLPILATTACGLQGSGITFVPALNAGVLIQALSRLPSRLGNDEARARAA